MITKKISNIFKGEKIQGNFLAIQSGDRRCRDEYGKWFPLLSHRAVKELLKADSEFKIIGDTSLNKANRRTGVIINGFRYNVDKKRLLRKCLGYIPCENKTIIRLTKSLEFPKLAISFVMIVMIGFIGFYYLNTDGTFEMMLNKVASNAEFRDSFNYSDQVVSADNSIEISNNTYNPVTLQYMIYSNSLKVFDTGLMQPGDKVYLEYKTYFKPGTYDLKIKTIAKSLDGLRVVSNNTEEVKITIKD